ncbi:hypothetical protein A3Q56_06913 [Intoshia linei]|uniref:Uncharacterized protein n=1 Tax=Intoshia linei TaxID=1819745 RepID=A0A177ATM8_9BILA|nr:hypothetical protein A3Q56_06913 [Intoshia linei]
MAARFTIHASLDNSDTGVTYKISRTINIQGNMLEIFDLPYMQETPYSQTEPI